MTRKHWTDTPEWTRIILAESRRRAAAGDRKIMERRPTCDMQDREVHGGRFQRCRRAVVVQIRQGWGEDKPWFNYCRECGEKLMADGGSSLEQRVWRGEK